MLTKHMQVLTGRCQVVQIVTASRRRSRVGVKIAQFILTTTSLARKDVFASLLCFGCAGVPPASLWLENFRELVVAFGGRYDDGSRRSPITQNAEN